MFLTLLACITKAPESPPSDSVLTTDSASTTDTDPGADDTANPDDTDDTDTAGTDTATTTEAPTPCPVINGFDRFITRDGDRLMDGSQELRFISFNVPNLHMLEDPYWHLPDPWEQEDALCSIVQLGGQVTRIYTLSVGDSYNDTPRHVTAPGEFSEDLYVALDEALALANRYGVRVIIPLVDQWSWWGGVAEYAAFRGLDPEDFWTDPQVREDFKATAEHLLTRTNTVTGLQYRDDPAILAWETGNELDAPTEWTADIAAFLKSLDPNHLVMDGRYGVDADSLANPDVDIVSNHYYWPDGYGEDIAAAAAADQSLASGARPFIVGEFGLIGTDRYVDLLDTVEADGIAGAMIWSLRFRDVGEGFYWHTEIDQPGYLVRAYHWPGFDSGDAYDESGVLALMRERAFGIQGLTTPDVAPPLAPERLSVDAVDDIRWRGTTGAGWYELERSASLAGPWVVVAAGFHDASAPNEARVADTSAVGGDVYYYRLVAGNDGGRSAPSAPSGPVTAVVASTLIDELDDFSKIAEHSADLGFDSANAGYFGGDTSRLFRGSDSEQWVRYVVGGTLTGFEVEVFFWPSEARGELVFEVGSGEALAAVTPSVREAGGDWERVVYTAEGLSGDTLRVTLAAHGGQSWNPQISRLTLSTE